MAKKVAITGTVTPALREAVEDYRWSHRMSLSDVVTEAIETWARAKGVTVASEVPASEGEGDKSARRR